MDAMFYAHTYKSMLAPVNFQESLTLKWSFVLFQTCKTWENGMLLRRMLIWWSCVFPFCNLHEDWGVGGRVGLGVGWHAILCMLYCIGWEVGAGVANNDGQSIACSSIFITSSSSIRSIALNAANQSNPSGPSSIFDNCINFFVLVFTSFTSIILIASTVLGRLSFILAVCAGLPVLIKANN